MLNLVRSELKLKAGRHTCLRVDWMATGWRLDEFGWRLGLGKRLDVWRNWMAMDEFGWRLDARQDTG